jgi:hypothetical protein
MGPGQSTIRTTFACVTIIAGALALCRAAWQLTHLPR